MRPPTRFYTATPARRNRTGFRSRTHLALPVPRRKHPLTLCQAENNTTRMSYSEEARTLEDIRQLRLGTKALCRNCAQLAERGEDA